MKKVVIDENTKGKICSVCYRTLSEGEYVVSCDYCNSLTHESCYKEHGCGSESCKLMSPHSEKTEIILTKEEVSNVMTVPENVKNPSEYLIEELNKKEKPFSKMAIFVGVFSLTIFFITFLTFFFKNPIIIKIFFLFSFLFGFLSLIFSCISLGLFSKNKRLRGLPLALTALFISVSTISFGFVRFLLNYRTRFNIKNVVRKVDKEKVTKIIEKAAPHIQEPLKSNVCIQSGYYLSKSFGSGVVVKNKDSKTYIVTNVHVLTAGSMVTSLNDAKRKTKDLSVSFYNGENQKAEILWVAPEGIDLALICCSTPDKFNSSVKIGSSNDIRMGEKVFAIGNPMGLDWTYTEGVVSSFRNRQVGKYEISVIQIQTPLNHGNSGGGLYSDKGLLVGINTWIYEKAKTEGLNFSIAIDELTKTIDSNLLKIIME